jgi:hypothetical protein
MKPINKHYSMLVIILLMEAQCLQSAVAGSNLGVLRINTSKSGSLAVGKLIHGCLSKVETLGSMVDSENIDGLSVVGDAVACSALV